MQEGYRFLDEKRLILAAEMLAELGRYERELASFSDDYRTAASALRDAVARHGLDGLAVYPPTPATAPAWRLSPRRVLGVTLQDLIEDADIAEQPAAPTLAESPEAELCRAAFARLIPRATRLAAMVANLQRLGSEYARTARRARALEDVLLPEIDETLRSIESALEELDREEVIRARRARW
jgi:V/A-type H+-transporting ATPase subunit D